MFTLWALCSWQLFLLEFCNRLELIANLLTVVPFLLLKLTFYKCVSPVYQCPNQEFNCVLFTFKQTFTWAIYSQEWQIQVANLGLYAITLAVFAVIKAKECSDIVLQVRESKACNCRPEQHKMFLVTNFRLHFFTLQYRWIAYLSIFIGCCFLVVFHIGTNEPTYVDRSFRVDICAV